MYANLKWDFNLIILNLLYSLWDYNPFYEYGNKFHNLMEVKNMWSAHTDSESKSGAARFLRLFLL